MNNSRFNEGFNQDVQWVQNAETLGQSDSHINEYPKNITSSYPHNLFKEIYYC